MNNQLLVEYIKKSIETELGYQFDILKKELLKKLDEKKSEICAKAVLDVSLRQQIDSFTNGLNITIKEIK